MNVLLSIVMITMCTVVAGVFSLAFSTSYFELFMYAWIGWATFTLVDIKYPRKE